MKKKIIYIAISVIVCLIIGFLSSIVTQTSVDTWFLTLKKPSFNPPNWLFAPVWTVLYILMGVSAGLVWAKGFYHKWVKTALYFFGLQLLFNATWSIAFFGLRNPLWALFIILVLLLLILLTIRWFRVIDRLAAYLLLPYLFWVLFATVLNYKIWELN
ncbi:TspO/MBR family protein [Costertonia aggregata]|uniref:Tryptophan-rich sensory protein n=1 Tax=Costertonia aggregata TaxID=343403 RepID=A0A7H9AQR9_9FLAO|nr:TspO/MBR family protein [Costertonia aggregata]QLG45749.1 tryptophan-rich sensory protein [Costertonia aggregata]